MPDDAPAVSGRQELIASYKGILRGFLEQRPSGIRARLARVLGTHKSFVSLIANPSDPTPIPARHLAAIAEVCHLSEAEQGRLLAAYVAAHPQHARRLRPADAGHPHTRPLHLEIPVLGDPLRQKEFEEAIRDFVRRLAAVLAKP
jgi:hypothetical protein